MKLARVIAPRKNPVGPQHDITGEEKKKKHRDRWPESRKQQHAKLSDVRHGTVESQAGAGRKQNLVNLRPGAEIGISGR
jgi:hypothetical protein